MIDEEERALWRLHTGHGDASSYERWAIVAARHGFPWGLDFIRASRRYPRAIRRAQFRSSARYGNSRVFRTMERARANVHSLRSRGRRALRELRRADRVPKVRHTLLIDLLDEEGQRILRRRRRETQGPDDDRDEGLSPHAVVASLLERAQDPWDGRRLVAIVSTRIGRVRLSMGFRTGDGVFYLDGDRLQDLQGRPAGGSATIELGTELPDGPRFDVSVMSLIERIESVLEAHAPRPRGRRRSDPWLARIRADYPQETYVIHGHPVFRRSAGWYQIPRAESARMREGLGHVFEFVRQSELIAREVSES